MQIKPFDRYTNIEKERILKDAGLTPREEKIFLLRKDNHSIVKISLNMYISKSTVCKDIKIIKEKIEQI